MDLPAAIKTPTFRYFEKTVMARAVLTTLTLICLQTCLLAQKNTYIGGEGALNRDVYDIIDNGTLLKKVPLISGYFGLNIRQDLTPKVFVETGLLRKYYNEGIGFKVFGGFSEGDAINCWFIPFRLGTRINIHKHKIDLVPVIGYTLAINSDYGYGDGGMGGDIISGHDTIYYSVYSKLSLTRSFPLLQTGMGVEFILLRTVLVSVAANYYTGFKNVIEQNIQYTHNSTTYTATGLSKGELVSFGVAVKYPISHLWNGNRR
jgi:hypothetical protein